MRRGPLAPLALLGLVLSLTAAAAPALAQTQPGTGQRVEVVGAEFPPVVLVDRSFYINVTLQNKEAEDHRLTLFATLYEGSSGTPCEGARAIQSISRFQKSVALAAGERKRIEGEPDHWAQYINGSRVTAGGTYEVCVWARLAQCPRDVDLNACFLDYLQLQQVVRIENTPPRPTATAEPTRGNTATRFAFRATAEDREGDEVRYTWDFGDGGSGQGAQVTHAFGRAGNYTVTVNATDGFAWNLATLRIEVAPGGASPGGGIPGFEAALLAVAVLTAAIGRAAGRR